MPARSIALLVIVLFAMLGYGFLLRPGEIPYSPSSDVVAYHLAAKEVLYQSWHAGRCLPFWRNDQVSGGPALTPNALYTYPLHFLFYVLHPADAVGWTLWIHLLLAAIGFWILGWTMGLSPWARLVMAIAGLFNFKMMMAVFAGWLPLLPCITLLPLFFAVTFYSFRSPGPRSALAVAVVGALYLHSGHLQIGYYAALFLMVYAAVRLAAPNCAPDRWRVAKWLSLGAVLAIGISLYVLVPMLAEAPLMSRGRASVEFLLAGHPVGPRYLLTFFHPEILGTVLRGTFPSTTMWEEVAYFGIIPLVLAGVGAISRRAPSRFLTIVFLSSALLALDTPIFRLLYRIVPGFSSFRMPCRMFFVTAASRIALAGIGVQYLQDKLVGGRAALVTAVVIALIAGEGTWYAHRYLMTVPQTSVMPPTDYGRALAGDHSLFRIAPIGRVIPYGWAARMGLELISGYEPYNMLHYQKYIQLLQSGAIRSQNAAMWTDIVGIRRWDLLDALNVKYLAAPVPLQLPPDRFEMLASFRNQPVFLLERGMSTTDVYLYRNLAVLPRVRAMDRVVSARGDDAMTAAIQANNLHDVAVVDEPGTLSSDSTDDRTFVRNSVDGYLAIETEGRARRFLLISEPWHPGWSARLDGETVPIQRADLALMGVWVPAGKHAVALEYRPLYWRFSVGVSLLFGAAFLGLLFTLRTVPKGMGSRRARGQSS